MSTFNSSINSAFSHMPAPLIRSPGNPFPMPLCRTLTLSHEPVITPVEEKYGEEVRDNAPSFSSPLSKPKILSEFSSDPYMAPMSPVKRVAPVFLPSPLTRAQTVAPSRGVYATKEEGDEFQAWLSVYSILEAKAYLTMSERERYRGPATVESLKKGIAFCEEIIAAQQAMATETKGPGDTSPNISAEGGEFY